MILDLALSDVNLYIFRGSGSDHRKVVIQGQPDWIRNAGHNVVAKYNLCVAGNHDMENVETWVCAICGRYDPVLTGAGDTNTTEWIGCDCNRY